MAQHVSRPLAAVLKMAAQGLVAKQGKTDMTYSRARLIIWNPDAYEVSEVREAATFILGYMTATAEEVWQAAAVL